MANENSNSKHDALVHKLADHAGIKFDDFQEVYQFLLTEAQLLDEYEEVIAHSEQNVEQDYKTYIAVTNRRVVILSTKEAEAPTVILVNNIHGIELEYGESPVGSILSVVGRKRKYTITKLPRGDGRRLADVVRTLVTASVDPELNQPNAIAFEGVFPMEYYEGLIGPNQVKDLQTIDYGEHRYVLSAVTGDHRGYFMIQWFRRIDGEWIEYEQGDFEPFRSNNLTLVREKKRPYQIQVYPASKLNGAQLLKEENITINKDAARILERYTYDKKQSGLKKMIELLKQLGFSEGSEKGDKNYQILKSSAYDHLKVRGKTYTFTKEGDGVDRIPINWEGDNSLHIEDVLDKKTLAKEKQAKKEAK